MGKRRGLVGFYVGAGVFVALALVAAFTWKPLAIGYYEWQIERKTPAAKGTSEVSPVIKGRLLDAQVIHVLLIPDPNLPAWEEADSLAGLGPAAGPAFRRLLRSENGSVRDLATVALAAEEATWALPMLVDLAGDEDETVAWQALITAELLTQESFLPDYIVQTSPNRPPPPKIKPSLPNCRQHLLDWWETEGRAKYGSGK